MERIGRWQLRAAGVSITNIDDSHGAARDGPESVIVAVLDPSMPCEAGESGFIFLFGSRSEV
jgi:hypothetical protein